MPSARQYVAAAIKADQEAGGHGILRDEEVEALERAMLAAEGADRLVLAGIMQGLGPSPIHVCGEPRRTEVYYLRCADLVIDAYERWLDEKRETKTL